MRTAGRRSLAERLEVRTCESAEAVAAAVFETLAAEVPFAFGCLATTDPASELITRAFKSRPLPMGDEEFAAAEYGAPDLNQFAEITRRLVPVGVLSIDTGGHPERCRRLADYMTPTFGFTDELRAACRAGGTTWGALAIYRGAGEPPFTAEDADRVAGVLELVARLLQRALFADGGPVVGETDGPAVLMLDGTRLAGSTPAAARQIEELGGWDHGALPANLLAVAATAQRHRQPATTRVLGRSGRWLVLRAMPLDGEGPSLVVSVDAAPHASISRLRLAARGLTAREQEVARLVMQGASTKDIAASLFLSPHTVQDHLKGIFGKLGVNSRRELVAQLVLADAAYDG